MRILHILRSVPFGGAQKMAIELAKEQAADDADVRVLATGRNAAGAERLLEACDTLPVTFSPGHPLNQLRAVQRELAEFRPDIVHFHLAPSWLAFALGARRSFATVAHLHTRPSLQIYPPNAKLRLHAALDARLLGKCDRLVAVSQWAADAWHKQYPQFAPCVVHNGVRLPQTVPSADEDATQRPFTVGIALRLSERKGLDEFLDIAKACYQEAPDIRFAVAGDGPLAGHYRAKAEAMGLGQIVDFRGFVQDIAAFWRSVDLGAFTSSVDTFGLSMVEPVALGRPVVAYRTGTGSDEVIDLCRGVTDVPYADAAAFAARIADLSGDHSRLDSMRQDGFADCAEHFSIASMKRGIDAVYGDAMSSREAH